MAPWEHRICRDQSDDDGFEGGGDDSDVDDDGFAGGDDEDVGILAAQKEAAPDPMREPALGPVGTGLMGSGRGESLFRTLYEIGALDAETAANAGLNFGDDYEANKKASPWTSGIAEFVGDVGTGAAFEKAASYIPGIGDSSAGTGAFAGAGEMAQQAHGRGEDIQSQATSAAGGAALGGTVGHAVDEYGPAVRATIKKGTDPAKNVAKKLYGKATRWLDDGSAPTPRNGRGPSTENAGFGEFTNDTWNSVLEALGIRGDEVAPAPQSVAESMGLGSGRNMSPTQTQSVGGEAVPVFKDTDHMLPRQRLVDDGEPLLVPNAKTTHWSDPERADTIPWSRPDQPIGGDELASDFGTGAARPAAKIKADVEAGMSGNHAPDVDGPNLADELEPRTVDDILNDAIGPGPSNPGPLVDNYSVIGPPPKRLGARANPNAAEVHDLNKRRHLPVSDREKPLEYPAGPRNQNEVPVGQPDDVPLRNYSTADTPEFDPTEAMSGQYGESRWQESKLELDESDELMAGWDEIIDHNTRLDVSAKPVPRYGPQKPPPRPAQPSEGPGFTPEELGVVLGDPKPMPKRRPHSGATDAGELPRGPTITPPPAEAMPQRGPMPEATDAGELPPGPPTKPPYKGPEWPARRPAQPSATSAGDLPPREPIFNPGATAPTGWELGAGKAAGDAFEMGAASMPSAMRQGLGEYVQASPAEDQSSYDDLDLSYSPAGDGGGESREAMAEVLWETDVSMVPPGLLAEVEAMKIGEVTDPTAIAALNKKLHAVRGLNWAQKDPLRRQANQENE